MMTQTHLLLAGALFARPGEKLRNTAIIIGALIPDAAIYTLFAWSKVMAIPERRVWDEIYWQEPWQTWTAAGNSIPLYLAIFLLGLVLLRAAGGVWRIGLFAFFAALAALSHVATDLPLHVLDAHRHFWPLSDYKFISPVSYWDPDHYGNEISIIEATLGVVLAIILFRRFEALWVRALLVLFVAAYIAVPVYFMLIIGHHG